MNFVSPLTTEVSTTNDNSTYTQTYYGDMLSTSLTDSSVTEWSATTFSKDEYVQVSDLKRIYRASKDATASDYPPSTPDVWTDYGATNSYACVDNMILSQSESTADFNMTFQFNTCNTLSVMNIDNIEAIHIVEHDNSTNTDVYDKTINLRSYGASSLYAYWYNPIILLNQILVDDLIWLPDATLTLSFTVTANSTGKVGAIVYGLMEELGISLMGSSVGFEDYSTYKVDIYGNTSFVRRGYANVIKAKVAIYTKRIDDTLAKLVKLRGKVSLFIGDERDNGFASMTTLGHIEKTTIPIDNPVISTFPMTIIGVI